MRLPPLPVALAIVAALPSPGARAEQEPVAAPEVDVAADAPSDSPEDRAAPVEVIRVDEQTPGATLPELLEELAGVRVRRLGGLEGFATVSIRGSSASQVLVLRDGVPLTSGSASEVNLAEIPLNEIERIEVYRGPSPAHFGVGGLGGVVNLVSRAPEGRAHGRAELGLGSFLPGQLDAQQVLSFSARRQISLLGGGRVGRARLLAAASLLDTEGDFTFLNDNGTLWESRDDFFARRENNDAQQVDAIVRAVAPVGGGCDATVSQSMSSRSQGVPGRGTALSSSARLRTTQSLTSLLVTRPAPSPPLEEIASRVSARVRRDEWIDPHGEIGVGREHDDDVTLDLAASSRAGFDLGRAGTGWVQGEVRYERFFARSRVGTTPQWGWDRGSAGLGGWATWTLSRGRMSLSPQGRVEVVSDRALGPGPVVAGGGDVSPAAPRVSASQQLDLTVRPTGWLALHLSGGLAQRPPSFLELLGNRGAVVGNPALRSESGFGAEVGGRIGPVAGGPVESAGLQLAGFYRHVDDLIQLVPNSQATFVATNVGGAEIAGLEATGAVRVDWASATRSRWPGWISASASLTFMDARDRSDRIYLEGRRLPLRPQWEVFARAEAGWGPLLVAYEVDYVAGNFLDPYNSFSVPERLLHSVEARLDLRRWRGPTVTLLARNLTDRITERVPVRSLGQVLRPVADVAGFPLPGVTLFLTVRWALPAAGQSG